MIASIIFGAKVIFFGLSLGVIVSIVIFVPITIYLIPYDLWVGGQHCIGKQLDKKKEGFSSSIKNATKLYGAWILRKTPNL